jgi:hypothetical protein
LRSFFFISVVTALLHVSVSHAPAADEDDDDDDDDDD